MITFFNTAYRYLKGDSGLPSVLPTKETLDSARENSRGLRLFCEGLEKFRKILYTEATTESAPEQSVDMEVAACIEKVQDQEVSVSEEILSPTKADQKPRKYVLASGESLFQSLYATDQTLPTSPGGASSSSTLVDPSSRKVSPSDSTSGTKVSPSAVKDFAYPSLDSKHVRDPLSIVDENTKLELMRQLKKMSTGKQNALKKAEKRKARNLALSAELDAAKARLQTKAVQADIARVQANAMILSNFVYRYAIQYGMQELMREQHSAISDTTKSAGEMSTDPPNDTENWEDIEDSVEDSAGLEDSDIEESEDSSLKQHDHDPAQGTCIGHEDLDFRQYEFSEAAGPATLWGILQSNKLEEGAKHEMVVDEANADEETANASDFAGPATLWGILQSDPLKVEEKDDTVADGADTVVETPSASGGVDPVTNWSTLQSERQAEGEKDEAAVDGVDAVEETSTPSAGAGPTTIWGILQPDRSEDGEKDHTVVDGANTAEVISSASGGHGAATLLDVLQWDQLEEESKDEMVTDEAAAIEEDIYASNGAGPATLWGILQSNQSQSGDEVKDESISAAEIITACDTAENQENLSTPTNCTVPDLVNTGGMPEDDDDNDANVLGASTTGAEFEEAIQFPGTNAGEVVLGRISKESDPDLTEGNSVAQAHFFATAIPDDEQGPEDPVGGTLEAPAQIGSQSNAIDNNIGKQDDQTTCKGSRESPRINTAEDGEAASVKEHIPPATSFGTKPPSPPQFSPPQPEKFDYIPPRQIQPTELSKTQKRRLERKRAAAKKAETAARMRMMEGEEIIRLQNP